MTQHAPASGIVPIGTVLWHQISGEPVARLLPNPGRAPRIEKRNADGWTEASIDWLRAALDPHWIATRWITTHWITTRWIATGVQEPKNEPISPDSLSQEIEEELDELGFGAGYEEVLVGRELGDLRPATTPDSTPSDAVALEPKSIDAELRSALDSTLQASGHRNLQGLDASGLLQMTSTAGHSEHGHAAWYCLRPADKIVGVCLLECFDADPAPSGPAVVGTLGYFGVVPAARGRGLGRRMHRAALDELRRLGAHSYLDATDIENVDMLRLFENHGCRHFAKIESRRFYGDHDAEKEMLPRLFNPKTASTFSRAFSTHGSDFTKIVHSHLLKQGNQEDQAKTFTQQGLESFSSTPKLLPTNEESLGIGTKGSQPSGIFSTTHDQLFGPKGLKSSSQIQDELALPDTNQANQLFRFKPNLVDKPPQFSGDVAPQGPSFGSDPVFSKDFVGGGQQIFTPGGTFQPQNTEMDPSLQLEKIQMGQEFDSAGKVPFEDTQ